MKRSFGFRGFRSVWVGALAVFVTFSITGCQTGSAGRADGHRRDTASLLSGEDVSRDRPCRFG